MNAVTRWYPLDPDFTLEIVAPHRHSAEFERRVDEIWEEQRRIRGPSLFDGPCFVLGEYRRSHLSLRPSSYRYTIARRFDPALAVPAEMLTLAVSALLTCPQGLVLGKRAAHVTGPGKWEAAPAGSLAEPDPIGHFYVEMEEELGLVREELGTPTVQGLVEDVVAGTLDILYRVDTPVGIAEILARQRRVETVEYDAIVAVPRDRLPDFLDANSDRLISLLKPTLAATGYLAG